MIKNQHKIGLIGLGYVGLPLSIEFGKLYETVGYDRDSNRVGELLNSIDKNLESSKQDFKEATKLVFTDDINGLIDCNIFIVTVPTPINSANEPDLKPLKDASELVGSILKPGDIVIYESTVFPGATEEVCVPLLEKTSGLAFNNDFFCGYSPERVNPGDKEHSLTNIMKITSGSTPECASTVDKLYRSIIKAGTYLVDDIKIAEAAKVIENIQRDVNIALVNELSQLFSKLEINTDKVLKAAETKWNFMSFKPGLVGGHCIGVDPYYLTHKAIESGFDPKIILAGREINNGMGRYVAEEVLRLMEESSISKSGSRILVLGLSFKEDCPDIRNTRVVDIIDVLKNSGCKVDVYDPWVDISSAKAEYNIDIINLEEDGRYDAVIIATSHSEFKAISKTTLQKLTKEQSIVYDVKSILPSDLSDGSL